MYGARGSVVMPSPSVRTNITGSIPGDVPAISLKASCLIRAMGAPDELFGTVSHRSEGLDTRQIACDAAHCLLGLGLHRNSVSAGFALLRAHEIG